VAAVRRPGERDDTAVRVPADVGHLQAQGEHRRQSAQAPGDQLRVLLPGYGIPLFSAQYKDGYTQGLAAGQKIYPMNGKSIAPVQTDPNQQVAQIEALLTAGQIDCISIEPATSSGSPPLQPDDGPGHSGLHRRRDLERARVHELHPGSVERRRDGRQHVLDYMHKNSLTFKNFAVSGGDPSQFWAQGRMTGFMNTIKAAIPDANFVNDPSTALNTSYDPAPTYDKAKAFLLGHPNVDVFQNSDIGPSTSIARSKTSASPARPSRSAGT